MKKAIFIIIITSVVFSCQSPEKMKEKIFIGNEWTVGGELIFRNDSSVSYKGFDPVKKKMAGDTTFPIELTDSTISYTLIKKKGFYNENKEFEINGDTTITDTVLFDIKFINEEPKLLLYSSNYPKICSSKKNKINVKETHNLKQIEFEISGYTIGDHIERDLLQTRGIYNYDTYTIEDCELKNKKNIVVKIIGYNQIFSLERHNVPNYRVQDVVKVVSTKLHQDPVYVPMRQLSEKSDYAYEFYRWNKNGIRIKLERSRYVGNVAYMNLLDSDTWTLHYDDDVKKVILIEQYKKSKPQSTIIN